MRKNKKPVGIIAVPLDHGTPGNIMKRMEGRGGWIDRQMVGEGERILKVSRN